MDPTQRDGVPITSHTTHTWTEAAWRAIAERSSDLVRIMDSDGTLLYASPSHREVLGYTPEELVGRSVIELFHPDEQELVRAGLRSAPAPGTMRRKALRMRHANGTYRTLDVVLQNRLEDPAVRGLVVNSHDITEWVAAEQALERVNAELARSNAELEGFATAAAHDLRAPLTTIGGFAELLRHHYADRLEERGGRYVTHITTAVEQLQQLIDDLLAYGREGAQPPTPAPVACQQVVQSVLGLLAVAVDEAGALVRCEGLPIVWGDESQIARLFQNLIANAIKFRRPEVLPEVTISAEQQGSRWLVRVCDNGIGIPPGESERVFGLFQRMNSSRDFPGTGLGLALCKRILERHGGRIWVESQPNQGSAFLFTLPAVPDHSPD